MSSSQKHGIFNFDCQMTPKLKKNNVASLIYFDLIFSETVTLSNWNYLTFILWPNNFGPFPFILFKKISLMLIEP